MFGARRQVGELMLAPCLSLPFVGQYASAFEHEINPLLAGVRNGLAISMGIQSYFTEARYGLERSILFITVSKNRAVVAGLRSEINLGLSHLRNVAMQPCGIHRPILSSKAACQQQGRQQQPSFNPGHDPPQRTMWKNPVGGIL